MKFVGTVTDKSWIDSIPKDLDLREKTKLLHDVKYVDHWDECLNLWKVHKAQYHRVYLDELNRKE